MYFTALYLDNLVKLNRTALITSTTRKFHEEFYSANAISMPSLSKVYSTVKENNSRKVVKWSNIMRNPIDQYEFLQSIAHILPQNLIDIDGII